MKILKILSIALFVLGAIFIRPVYADSTINEVVKRGTLRVGFSTFVPWAFVNKKGAWVGYEIDVATKLAEDLGVTLELIPTAWDGIIPALNAGKFDIIIGGMSLTTKRNLTVNFSAPYGGMEYVILASIAHKNLKMSNINSRKYTFTARRGALPATITKTRFPKAKILQFDDDGVAGQEVINGKADFTVTTATDAATRIDAYPAHVALLENGKSLAYTPASMALRKGDMDTLNVINNWILLNKNSGWLQQQSDYWFKTKKWKDQLPQ